MARSGRWATAGRLSAISATLLGWPLFGAALAGQDLTTLLELPPRAVPTVVTGFQPVAFVVLALCVGSLVIALATLVGRRWRPGRERTPWFAFPWWGWAALSLGAVSWALAWNRFSWFSDLQLHTFTPLWIAYILTVNALAVARTGRSLMTAQPRAFLMLFPLSALFWWFFEYLNRFTGNWRYVNVEHFSPIEYALFASLAFSTVLPAVLSTNSLLFGATSLTRVFTGLPAICPNASRRLRPWAYGFAALSLFLVPVWPQYLYPLVWLAPLPAVVAIQRWCGQSSGFEGLSHGDWRQIVIPAFSALICGFFWELWNWNSLAHWTYQVPFVDTLRIFRMPVLGYAGYLPFGTACIAVAMLLAGTRPACQYGASSQKAQ